MSTWKHEQCSQRSTKTSCFGVRHPPCFYSSICVPSTPASFLPFTAACRWRWQTAAAADTLLLCLQMCDRDTLHCQQLLCWGPCKNFTPIRKHLRILHEKFTSFLVRILFYYACKLLQNTKESLLLCLEVWEMQAGLAYVVFVMVALCSPDMVMYAFNYVSPLPKGDPAPLWSARMRIHWSCLTWSLAEEGCLLTT